MTTTQLFFIKHASPQHSFSPSYRVIGDTQEDAIRIFNLLYRPFIVGSKYAVVRATLYRCEDTQDPGQEILIREALTTTIAPSQEILNKYPSSYTHPLDKTVYHEEIPPNLIDALRPLLYFEHRSFPNGSNYSVQKIREGNATLPGFGDAYITRSGGIQVRIGKWDVYSISGAYYHGPGTNFGAYFCTQDQYLTAFRKKASKS